MNAMRMACWTGCTKTFSLNEKEISHRRTPTDTDQSRPRSGLPHERWALSLIELSLELLGALVSQARVQTSAVVPALDPLEQARPRLATRRVSRPVHQLAL